MSHINKLLTHRFILQTRPLSTRISSSNISFDTHTIASNPDLFINHIHSRYTDTSLKQNIDKISHLHKQRIELIKSGQHAKHERNELSGIIGKYVMEKNLTRVEELKQRVDSIKKTIADTDIELAEINKKINELFLSLPNLLDDRVPEGADDTSNIQISEWGADRRKMGEGHSWHDDIGHSLGGLDLQAAVRISGARFSVLTGALARLERALIQYFLDYHISRGYTEVSVPLIVNRSALKGTGQIPKFEPDLFKVNHSIHNEDAFLLPTGEVPLTNLVKGELLEGEVLPLRLAAYTPCFRAEAGSHGRDTRGLLRQHQFHKVEIVRICSVEDSENEYAALCEDAEGLLRSLGLPYRKMMLCSGDTGFSASLCHDLEVWMPAQQTYREVSSCSNCKDFQSRRMGTRYRPGARGSKVKPVYPHTMNASGLAVGRILAAILENFHREDGSVVIPEVLESYMGGLHSIQPQLANDRYNRT